MARLQEAVILSDSGTWGDDPVGDTGHPVLRSSNIQDFRLSIDGAAIRHVPAKHLDSKRLADGDIIVTTSSGSPSHIGKCALFVAPDDNPYYFSNFTLRLRPHADKADARWLYYWLSSDRGRAVIDAMNSTTSGLRNLNKGLYLAQKLPLPPLPEQERIAAILDKADAIRRKRRKAVALTEDLLRSAFLDMFGDPVTNPKGWPVVKMDRLIKETQYGTSQKANEDGKGLPVLRMNNVTADGRVDLSSLKWVVLPEKEIPKRTVYRGDLMFNRTNSPELVGKTAVWHADDSFALAGYLIRVRFHSDKADPDYVSGFLNSAYGKKYLFVKAKPSNNMSNFSASELRKVPIPAPPIDEQRRFARFCAATREVRNSLVLAERQDDDLFLSLAQRAFRGDL